MDNLTKNDNFAKRMSKEQVKKLILHILNAGGDIRFTDYCEKRMLERGITAPTIINVLSRGIVQDGEEYLFSGDSQWRYRVETVRYRAVVAFEMADEVIVINAIDFAPHLTGRNSI
jgi:hypothetical protein